MPRIIRSALFKRQLLDITVNYRERAGSPIALKFVEQVEDCITFVAARPQACAVYSRIEGREFRKWGVKGFPVSLFFRLDDETTIVLEALYAHRMDIAGRFSSAVE